MPPDRLEISVSSSPRKWGFDETASLMTNRQIDYCVCLQTFLITLQQMNQQPRKQIGDRNVAGVQTNRLRIRWNSDGWTDKQTDNRSKNSFFQACCSFSSSSGGRSSPTLQQPRYVWLRMSAVGVGIAPATNVRAPCVRVCSHPPLFTQRTTKMLEKRMLCVSQIQFRFFSCYLRSQNSTSGANARDSVNLAPFI